MVVFISIKSFLFWFVASATSLVVLATLVDGRSSYMCYGLLVVGMGMKKLMWSLIYKKRCCGYELLKAKNYSVETTKSFFYLYFHSFIWNQQKIGLNMLSVLYCEKSQLLKIVDSSIQPLIWLLIFRTQKSKPKTKDTLSNLILGFFEALTMLVVG